MEAISPTASISASQRTKKVSIPDDPPLTAWIVEVVETLNRPVGVVKVAKEHMISVRDQLSELQETGDEVDPHLLETLVEILGKNGAMCRRLKPDAFSLLVEVLIETKESDIRARGLYVLAESLHMEGLDAVRQDLFQNRLDLIGQGCLLKLYDQFTEKSVPYNSRRWMGILVLTLIGESEDNQEIVALMSTSKRAKLGPCILYEASEILRSITGRIITVMLAAEHPIKQFFPPGTAEKLFEKYPVSAQSASQWDKTFQEYVDEVWEDICADNESNGELQFAQNIATEPPHPSIQATEPWHRSIYIELSESVRVYMHSGKGNFDSAIDVPFTSIGGIATAITPIDGAQQTQTVDVVLTLMQSAHCFVNSLYSSLSALRLTVGDQSIADGIVDGISRMILHAAEERKVEQQVAASSPAMIYIQGSSQSKKSCSEEDLILDGSYTVVNESFVEAPVMATLAQATQNEEAGLERQMQDVEGAEAIHQEKEAKLLERFKALKDVTDAATEKDLAVTATKQTSSLKNTVEVDVIRDVATGKVLSSKVLNVGGVAPERPETTGLVNANPRRIIPESSDQLAGDDSGRSPEPPQEKSLATEEHPGLKKTLPLSQKKQLLKSKAPIRGPKTAGNKKPEPGPSPKQVISTLSSKAKALLSSPAMADVAKKSKLVAPSRKSNKVSPRSDTAKRAVDTHVEVGNIYDVSSSPPRANKGTKAPVKGKKAAPAPPAKASRTYGSKSKSRDNTKLDDVEDTVTIVEPDRSLFKVKKEVPKKKPSNKAPVETVAATSCGKRITALRSTKGRKSMKDLSDSEIEQYAVEEVASKEQASAIKNMEAAAKPFSNIEQPRVNLNATEMMSNVSKASQRTTSKPHVANKDAIGQPTLRQPRIDDETNDHVAPAEDQATSPPSHESNTQAPFGDATVAASVGESDDLDMVLLPTATVQNPMGTVEAKIGRKMAEIFGFASANAQTDSKNKPKVFSSPQKPSPTGLKSSLHSGSKTKSKEVANNPHVARPLPVSSDCIEAAIDNDEFLVLSSPPKANDKETRSNVLIATEPSSAETPLVVTDSDEELSLAQIPDKTSIEKRTRGIPIADNPSKRQRVAKAVVVSSPPQSKTVPPSKRGAIKAKVQARKQATPIPKGSPYLVLKKEDESSIDRSTFVDDHQARKTPLIAFGPQGPRNQGLSNAVKATSAAKQNESNTLSGIKLSKQSVKPKPLPAEQPAQISTGVAVRKPRVPSFEDSLAHFDSATVQDRSDPEDSGMAFFDAGQSVASSRSISRVDVNGSPQPRRPPLAQIDSLSRVAKSLGFTSGPPRHKRRPSPETLSAERRPNDEIAFDDDTTLFGSGLFISSNRKVRPAAPQDDLDFQSRYTLHHPADDGAYVGVADKKVIDAAPQIADPFTNKVKRQDSAFSRRLRVSADQKAEREVQPQDLQTSKAQARIRHSVNTLPQPARLRSLADADATLVDIENSPPRRSKKSRWYESSSDSSDSGASAQEGKDEPATPTAQQVWRDALKPHQQDVSNVLHHVVDGLLQQLFDKEPAVQAISDEYRVNGTKIVEQLKSKLDADIRALNAHTTSTIENLAKGLRQSRAALQASSSGSKELDDQYKAWRCRQHALQSLPFMARDNGKK